MFREMRRSAQQLDRAECIEILERGSYGILALMGDGGYPYPVPLNYIYMDGFIYFHGAKSGHKLDALSSCSKAGFCVVDKADVIAEKLTTAYRSVIAFGEVSVVEEEAQLRAAAMGLGEKYNPGHRDEAERETDAFFPALCIFRLEIEHLSGKQGKELMK